MDGQTFSNDGRYLYVAHNEANVIYRFVANDSNWFSMRVKDSIDTRYSVPTSIALENGNSSLFVVSSYWNIEGITNYPIQLINFDDIYAFTWDDEGCIDDVIDSKLSALEWILLIICFFLIVLLGWCAYKLRSLKQEIERKDQNYVKMEL